MQALKDKILSEGKYLGKGILKVDSFMNHQIDPQLMKAIGLEFAKRFKDVGATRILTAETSGIAPALTFAIEANLPLVFARKHRPVTMVQSPYTESAESHTHGKMVELIVSPEYLKKEDRVIIIDDFLASARTIKAMIKIVSTSGATLVGIGAVIEKTFEGGRAVISALGIPEGIPVESLAAIKNFDGETINF
jgi:xanthine phosphoribosyltransferase